VETVLIAANPKSGSKSRFQLVAELEHHIGLLGYRCEVITQLEELERRARILKGDHELRAVVAAGGDGTISAVAERTPIDVPLRILPLGSENLLANYLSISRKPIDCAEAIHRNQIRQLDGMDVGGRLAFVMVSVGFDAEVVRRVHQSRKSHITRWAYRYSALAAWILYGWPAFSIRIHRVENNVVQTVEGTGQWCFVFNVPRYATGLSLLPDSDPSDGLLNVGYFERSGRIRGIFQYLQVLRGNHRSNKHWRDCLASEVQLSDHPNGYTPHFQYDGDWGGMLPVSIRVVARRLKLVI
jgi:diacylglycerol kinase family enzyme